MIKQALEFAGKIYKEDDLVEVGYHMYAEAQSFEKEHKNIRGRLCDIRGDAFTIDYSEEYHAGVMRIFFDMVDYIGPMKGSGAGEQGLSSN